MPDRSPFQPEAHKPHRSREKLPALERIQMHKYEVPAAGIVTGVGKVSERWRIVMANATTVKSSHFIELCGQRNIPSCSSYLYDEIARLDRIR